MTVHWSDEDLARYQRAHGPAPAPCVSEKAFMQAVLRLARAHQWLAYHPFDSRRSLPGYPDLTLIRNGRCLWSELKVDGASPTLQQWHWLEALRQVTHTETHLWTPDDWPLIRQVLAR